jgi:hypothetical protein
VVYAMRQVLFSCMDTMHRHLDLHMADLMLLARRAIVM